jgi:N-acyl-D-aspartate/D-glutamate deacylase
LLITLGWVMKERMRIFDPHFGQINGSVWYTLRIKSAHRRRSFEFETRGGSSFWVASDGNASVMNLDLYDIENTRFLAKQDWMMTCTDGRPPAPGTKVTHPRVSEAFTRKIRQFVIEEGIVSMPFAIRSMTGLAADFLKVPDRGYIRKNMYADIAVFDRDKIRDLATYEDPHHYSEGAVHVIVNGTFALKDSKHTGALAGVPILRGGKVFGKNW